MSRLSLSAVALLLFVCGRSAHAATFTVTRFDDPAPDGCAVDDCSLREAVIAANAAAGADAISLPAGTYTLTIAGNGTDDIDPAIGDLDIGSGGLTISGAGSASTIINASAINHRAFHIPVDIFFTGSVAFSGVTITGGNSTALGASNRGGAINAASRFASSVTLTDVVITGNISSSAVDSRAHLTITNSTISGNTGHGVFLTNDHAAFGNLKDLSIQSSTIDHNTGNGVHIFKGNNLLVQNSTISTNSLDGVFLQSVTAVFDSATIAGNTSNGIEQLGFLSDGFPVAPIVSVKNSIIAGNTAGDLRSSGDGATLPTSNGNNIIGDNTGVSRFTQPTDMNNTNPQLQALALNAPGMTRTHAFPATSPAFNNGNTALTTDQRGVARPQGGVDDIGAFELVPPDDDMDGFSPPADCDDNDDTIFPGATEIPDDGIDQDCNGFDTVTCFVDADGDGFGSSATLLSADGDCDDPGQSDTDDDCDDGDETVGAPTTLYEDADGDGAGDPDSSIVDCPTPGYVDNADDECPDDPDKISAGACGCGETEDDADGDNVPDCIDDCPDDPDKTEPGECGCGTPDDDDDADGTPNCIDDCPDDPDKTEPGLCGCGASDDDSDSDGTPDCNDDCPDDPAKTAPGACGCGVSDDDSDSDGTPDCNDGCPADPAKTAPGACGCGVSDADSDGDGTLDCNDGCPNDPAKTEPGAAGCGNPEAPPEQPQDPAGEDPAPQPVADPCDNPISAAIVNIATCGAGCPLAILGASVGLLCMSGRPRSRIGRRG